MATAGVATPMVLTWYCQVVPAVTSPAVYSWIWAVASDQYEAMFGRWPLRRFTAASNCVWSSSYGFLMPRSGLVDMR